MDEQKEQRHEERRRKGHGFWSGLLFGVLGASLLAGIIVSTTTVSAAGRWLAASSHQGFQRAGLHDPEKAKERAGFALELLLGSVDATDVQTDEVKAIVGGSIDALLPLAEEHRIHRDALHTELSKETLDRVAIEEIRQAELALADQASQLMVNAMLDAADVLTAEQRNELIELASRFHR
jgi:Spy/CpxP family protein refolding chaperone